MTRTDEPEQTRKRPTDDGEVSRELEQTRGEAAAAADDPDAVATRADPSSDMPRAAPNESARPIDTAQIADWLEDEARTSYSGREPLEIAGHELLKPGEKREPLSTLPPGPETGRPVGAVSGGMTKRSRMPVRTAIGLAITGAAIGVAAVWARSRDHAETPPASQTLPAASSINESTQTGAPVAPAPRRIEDRSAGVDPAPAPAREAAEARAEDTAKAEDTANGTPTVEETAPRHPAKQSVEGRALPPIGANSKTMGKLYLVSRSADVIVQFQGRSQRVPSVMTLPVGKQTIRVKRGDHEPVDLPIEVVSGRTTTVALD